MRRLSLRLGVLPFLLLGAGLFVIGLLSLNHITNNWWPFDVARLDLVRATAENRINASSILDAANSDIILAFLTGVLITTTGLALPLAYVLNKRFGLSARPGVGNLTLAQFLVTLRQAMWVGMWISFCFWLQMNRALGIAVAILVAGVLILFEVLLQVRTRAADMGTQEVVIE